MRKWTVLLLAAILAAALILPALAADTVIRVELPPALPRAGETFSVEVRLSGPDAASLQFTLTYDADAAQLDGCTLSPQLTELGELCVVNRETPGTVRLALASPGAVHEGALLTLQFRSARDITDFIQLSMDMSAAGVSDSAGNTVTPVITGIPAEASPAATPPAAQSGGSGSGATGYPPRPAASPAPAPTATPAPTAPAETPRFTDTAGHWGEAYIGLAAARGLFRGYDDGRFGPDDPVTRAQFMTVVWRMAGSPAAENAVPFTDTGGEIAEFRSAIAWGYGQGYINGVAPDRFAPSGALTREQAMKILFLYAGGSDAAASLSGVYDRGFADSGEISDWAKAPMYWGVYNRIISGAGDGLLSPGGTATRAQLAKILVVYMDEVAGSAPGQEGAA